MIFKLNVGRSEEALRTGGREELYRGVYILWARVTSDPGDVRV